LPVPHDRAGSGNEKESGEHARVDRKPWEFSPPPSRDTLTQLPAKVSGWLDLAGVLEHDDTPGDSRIVRLALAARGKVALEAMALRLRD
jgi:hypothetical protein